MNSQVYEPRSAFLNLDTWAGRARVFVTVIAETPKRFRVRCEQRAFRMHPGEVRLVPKYAITFVEESR